MCRKTHTTVSPKPHFCSISLFWFFLKTNSGNAQEKKRQGRRTACVKASRDGGFGRSTTWRCASCLPTFLPISELNPKPLAKYPTTLGRSLKFRILDQIQVKSLWRLDHSIIQYVDKWVWCWLIRRQTSTAIEGFAALYKYACFQCVWNSVLPNYRTPN